MKVNYHVQRYKQHPLHSTIPIDCTDNINEVIEKVFEKNKDELSAKAASALVAKHWESIEDQSCTISITKKDCVSAIDKEIAATHILVTEDAPPSGSFIHSYDMHSQPTFLVAFT